MSIKLKPKVFHLGQTYLLLMQPCSYRNAYTGANAPLRSCNIIDTGRLYHCLWYKYWLKPLCAYLVQLVYVSSLIWPELIDCAAVNNTSQSVPSSTGSGLSCSESQYWQTTAVTSTSLSAFASAGSSVSENVINSVGLYHRHSYQLECTWSVLLSLVSVCSAVTGMSLYQAERSCFNQFMSQSGRYRYQVFYQIGVLVSRSTVTCFPIKTQFLFILPVLQVSVMD